MGKLAGSHFNDNQVRACQNKRRFLSLADCLRSIEAEQSKVPLKPYRCGLCGFWHKTKQVHGRAKCGCPITKLHANDHVEIQHKIMCQFSIDWRAEQTDEWRETTGAGEVNQIRPVDPEDSVDK